MANNQAAPLTELLEEGSVVTTYRQLQAAMRQPAGTLPTVSIGQKGKLPSLKQLPGNVAAKKKASTLKPWVHNAF